MITYKLYKEFQSILDKELAKNEKVKIEFTAVKENLINKIWEQFEELPSRNFREIKSLDINFTGRNVQDKLADVKSI